MKVAIVQDWLTEMGGAEKVVKEILSIFPEADLFTLVANKKVLARIGAKAATESFLCHLPFAKRHYRKYLQFYTLAIEGFDLSGYDLVISSSSSVAKGVLTSTNQVHICYCHTPARYIWELSHKYLKDAGLSSRYNPLAFYARKVMHKFRMWDVASANRVDYFIANSYLVAKRIQKVYKRDSQVIYPPVDVDYYSLSEKSRKDYYFTVSRMVSYKKIDLIVEAFSKMSDKELYVAGIGPELKKVKKLASKNVHFLGYVNDDALVNYMSEAKAFVFAAEEDFGIVPIEAQACGTPIINYAKGGTLETCVDGVTGISFQEQTVDSLIEAVCRFESMSFDRQKIRENAERFSSKRFRDEFLTFVKDKCESFNLKF